MKRVQQELRTKSRERSTRRVVDAIEIRSDWMKRKGRAGLHHITDGQKNFC
jgi:hypothetical protein